MRFEKQVSVKASRQAVWEFLWDVPRLAACIPGCQEAEELEPYQRYQATVQERVGPFKVKVPLAIEVSEHTAPARLIARAHGRDQLVQSHVKIELDLTLIEVTPQVTELRVQTDITILGKLGTLGHSVIIRKGDAIVGQFAAALQEALDKEPD